MPRPMLTAAGETRSGRGTKEKRSCACRNQEHIGLAAHRDPCGWPLAAAIRAARRDPGGILHQQQHERYENSGRILVSSQNTIYYHSSPRLVTLLKRKPHLGEEILKLVAATAAPDAQACGNISGCKRRETLSVRKIYCTQNKAYILSVLQ